MLNPNLQAPHNSTPTEELVKNLIENVPISAIAFIGSDKENKGGPFPGNILCPAIEKWFEIKKKYPRFLSLHLGIIGKSYSNEANINWLQSIAKDKTPVVLFHPNPTDKSPTKKNPTADEIYILLENEYSWCTFENGNWTEPSGTAFPFRTKIEPNPFPPTLFVPEGANVETLKTDLNEIMLFYYTLIEAHKPKKR